MFLILGGSVLLGSPIEISNSGIISIDQDTGFLVISGDVEAHQAPFYLYSDRVVWNQTAHLLHAQGNVRLMLHSQETGADKYLQFVSNLDGEEETNKKEILTTHSLFFDTLSQTIKPEGLAKIQLGLVRIIGEDFSINLKDDTLTTGHYRVGMETLFLEGEELVSNGNSILAKNAHFYLGEPEKLSIQGYAREIEKISDETIILRGMLMKLGPIPFFYLPYYHHHPKQQVFSVSGSVGMSGDIGAYIELRPTYSPLDNIRVFADLNFYSERGIMAGPGFNLSLETKNGQTIQTKFESGAITDNGNLGIDSIGQPIDDDRHYIDIDYIHRFPNSLQIIGKLQRWSDSEIIRDFDSGKFRRIQQPENFIEASWIHKNWAATIASQFRHEDFEYAIEKLPEYNLQLLPSPVFGSGLYHSASAGGVHMRNRDPNQLIDLEYTRFRAYYELIYPIAINSWLDLIPKATAHTLYYDGMPDETGNIERHHVEIGFDLNAHAYGQWNLQHKVWDIDGIRHLLRPTIQFRNIQEVGTSQNSIHSPIEHDIFRTGLDDIDLSASTHLDDLKAYSLLRIGVSNSIVAKDFKGEMRELLKFDLFHDLIMPEEQYDLPDRSMLIGNIQLKPAYWIRMNIQSRFDTDEFKLNDLFGRLRLMDGDIWDIDLSTQFLRSELQQYLFKIQYKVFENIRFIGSVGYDADRSRVYEQTYGFQIGIGNYWEIYINVRFREGSLRNKEPHWNLKVLTTRF